MTQFVGVLFIGVLIGMIISMISAPRRSKPCLSHEHDDWTKWQLSSGGQYNIRTCNVCGWTERKPL